MFITNEQKYAYQLLHDAYYGSGLFSLGRGLKQHPRESIDNFPHDSLNHRAEGSEGENES